MNNKPSDEAREVAGQVINKWRHRFTGAIPVEELATIIQTALDRAKREQREVDAGIAGKSSWAPVDYGGLCLECKEWTPPNHSERWEHLESCSWATKEFRKSPRIAAAIRKGEG